MSLDPIALLNSEIPGDPQTVRILITFVIGAAAFGWGRDVRRRWWDWDYGIRRNAIWLTGILIVNGLALIAASQRDDPLRLITAVLGTTFLGLAISLFTPAHKRLLHWR